VARVSISYAEAGTGDDSAFYGPLFDTGTCGDSLGTGPASYDTGTCDDAAVTVAVAAPLAEAGAGDDLPWEFDSVGLPLFPYYALFPQAALTRVQVGDKFLWYAGS
jgi:hypothetical protein